MTQLLKNQIRQNILAKRNSFVIPEEAIDIITTHFIENIVPLLKPEAILAGYYPSGSELNLLPLLKQLANLSFQIALPIINSSKSIDFYAWQPGSSMIASKYASQILEPKNQHQALLPDLVIAPLIACDGAGNRIGSGKAMYDKSIAKLKALKPNLLYIGLCYDFQLLDNIPTQEHDQKLDLIITEKKHLVCES